MSGRKAGKRKRRASEAARSRWSPPSLGTKDVGCQVNFFGEEPCLKDTSTVATQTEESTVEVEMVTPISAEKIAVSEVEVCADKDDEMFPWKDFYKIQSCLSEKHQLKNQMKLKGMKKQSVKWKAFFALKAMTLDS